MPPGSGACPSSTLKVMSAWPSSVSSMSFTEPIETPPACTGLPFTIWPAFTNLAVTV